MRFLADDSIEERAIEFIEIKFKIPIFLEKILVFPLLLCRYLRYGYAFRRIPLTRGLYAIVDPEDYHHLARQKWYAQRGKNCFYAARNSRGPQKKMLFMHRQILKIPDHLVVDHINHNGLDNRKANLRPATITQNNFNQRRCIKNGTSKYKGVSWRKDRKKWSAQIQVNRRIIRLGCFDNETTAAKAYDTAAIKYHGQYACLNFPVSPSR